MKLKSIQIRQRETYEPNPGKFVAEIRFDTSDGKMDIPLAPEVSEKLMEVLTPLIVEFSQRATAQLGEMLTQAIQDRKTPAIEA